MQCSPTFPRVANGTQLTQIPDSYWSTKVILLGLGAKCLSAPPTSPQASLLPIAQSVSFADLWYPVVRIFIG